MDAEVSRRIKLERQKAGLSQGALGAQIGVTFQQVQKYESGSNRVTIGRLVQIAVALGIPVAAFTDGLEALSKSEAGRNPSTKRKRKG